MNEKYKKTCKYFNYAEHFLILVSTVTGCVSISAFASLVWVPVSNTSSAVEIEIRAITAGFKKYKLSIKNMIKKKYDKIVLLGKSNLDLTEFLIYKSLIDTFTSHNYFFW